MSIASRTLSITEARKRIFELTEGVQNPGVYFTLTEKGRACAVLMSVEEFEGWMETMDIVAEDPNIVQELRVARTQFARGEYVTLEQLKETYGLSDSTHARRGKRVRKSVAFRKKKDR